MINTLTKLAQKPTDKNIRITRVVFAFVLAAIIYFGYDVTAVNWGLPAELKYAFYLFPAIGLIRGLLDPGIWRKGIWRWVITGLGAVMLLSSLLLIDDISPVSQTPVIPVTTVSGVTQGVDISTLITDNASTDTAFSLSTDNWFGFFGPILMLMGFLLNGKNTTAKNERYGEVIKKIRV
jgi:hypothetical protein